MQPPPRNIGIVAAHGNEDAKLFARTLAKWVESNGCAVVDEEQIRDGGQIDVLIVLGGDGLMMHMAQTVPGTPILGINFGTVGFLAMVERAQWLPVMEQLMQGDYKIQNGPTLAVTHNHRGEQLPPATAINDVVIRSGYRMIDVELYIDGRFVNTYPGDGMIVASPQGSTAYCMAAGGPILTAGVTGFAVTPLAPHSPIRTTLVVPEECLIEMVLANDREADLIVDGVVIRSLSVGDLVTVTHGEIPFRMILVDEMNFYEAFRSKFNYLIRPGAVPSLGQDRVSDKP